MTGRPISLFLGFALFACAADVADIENGDVSDSIDVVVAPVQMPAFPLSTAGQLAVVTSHGQPHYLVRAAWTAWAGRCGNKGLIQVIARTDSHGVALLLAPPKDDTASWMLPVRVPNDSTPPDSSARVALQIYPSDRAYVLRGVDGTVQIDSLTKFISGRFATRIVETSYRDTVYAAGSFSSVPIETVGDEYCRSLSDPTPTIPGEGLEPKPVPIGQSGDHD